MKQPDTNADLVSPTSTTFTTTATITSRPRSFPHVLKAMIDEPWAIMQTKLDAIVEVVNAHIEGAPVQYVAAQSRPQVDRAGGTAVVPIHGVIAQRMDLFSEMSGGTSTERVSKELRTLANDDTIRNIVLDISSPGGSVFGVTELAQEIFEARKRKNVVAVANSLAASAAFWLATQANEFVVTPGGEVGSVGVVALHVDQSKFNEAVGIKPTFIHAGKFKVEGNPHEPLDDDAHDFIQSRVDEHFDRFIRDVARGRGVAQKDVRNGFGQGRVLGAEASVKEGMADRVAPMRSVLADLSARHRNRKRRRAQASLIE